MFGVIVDWHAPFAIVILEHQRIVHADPGTSFRSHKLQDVTASVCANPALANTVPCRNQRRYPRWEAVAAAGASATRPNVVRSSMSSRAFAASLTGFFR